MTQLLPLNSEGDVKIWQNGLDFSLIESFNFETKIDFVSVAAKSASVISTSGRKFRIDAANDNGQWNNVFLKTLDQNVSIDSAKLSHHHLYLFVITRSCCF